MTKRRTAACVLPLLLCCPLSNSAPQEDENEESQRRWRPVALHYENSDGEKGRTLFRYDHNGLNDRARWEILDGTRHSENFHTFDDAGRLKRKHREFSDELTSDTFYSYYEGHGLLAAEHFTRSDGVEGVVRYGYDGEEHLRSADCRGMNGWFHGNIIYTYDANWRRKGATVKKEGQRVGSISFQYDEHGELAVERWDLGAWNQTFTWEYESYVPRPCPSFASSNAFVANTARARIAREEYDFDGTGGPSHYEYGEDGRLEKKIFERSDGLRTQTTYEYGDDGLLTRSHREYANGLTAEFTYEFNGNRRLTRRTFARSDGVTGHEEYTYDACLRLARAKWENVDSWLTGFIKFTHDERGFPIRGQFRGRELTADLTLMIDEFGNPTRIHWDFSSGKTQTYTFAYETPR